MCDFSALSATVEGSSELCSAATRKLCAPICCSRFQFFDFLILHFLIKLLKEDPQILNRAWRSPRHAQGSLTYCYYKGIDAGQPVLHSCSVQSPSRTLYRRNPTTAYSIFYSGKNTKTNVNRDCSGAGHAHNSPKYCYYGAIDAGEPVLHSCSVQRPSRTLYRQKPGTVSILCEPEKSGSDVYRWTTGKQLSSKVLFSTF